MGYPVFAEVHCTEVSLNRLPVGYYIPAKIIAQTWETAAASYFTSRQIIAADDCPGRAAAAYRTFLFPVPSGGTYHWELVNSLLCPCHYHDAKPELPLTSFLRAPLSRLSFVVHSAYLLHRRK